MNRLRVTEVICPVEFGGGENQILLRAIELKKRGIDVKVICLASSSAFEAELSKHGINYLVLSKRKLGFSPSLFRYIVQTLVIIPPLIMKRKSLLETDIMNAHGFPSILIPVLLKFLKGKAFKPKIIYTHHSYPRSGLFLRFRKIFEYILSKYDCIMGVSTKVKEKSLSEVFPSLSYKMDVVPNGISIEDFDLTESKQAIRHRLGLPVDEIIGIYPARFAPQKNHMFLLKVLTAISGFKLILAGDGATKENFLSEAKKLNLLDRIILTGNIPHSLLIQYLHASDVCLFPSLEEGFGVAIVEAMACGLPTIIFRSIYMKEHGNNIIVAESEDEFLEYTKRLISDKKWRDELSEKVKADARKLSIAASTDKYINLCKRLINESWH